MKVGDRLRYRDGGGPAENGVVVAVHRGEGNGAIVEIRLETGAQIKVIASGDWSVATPAPPLDLTAGTGPAS